MKVKNELARQIMGEILGTFVLLVSFCIVFTIKQTEHSYWFIDIVYIFHTFPYWSIFKIFFFYFVI